MAKKMLVTDSSVYRKVVKGLITDNSVYRKVKKGFVTESGVYRQFFSSDLVITYSGNMTDEVVTMSGQQYRLLTLTSSGTLNISEAVDAEVWMCGGGTSGCCSEYHGSGGGGAGAFCAFGNITLVDNMIAVIGAGGNTNTSYYGNYNKGTASSFGEIQTSINFTKAKTFSGISGGTGGGTGSELDDTQSDDGGKGDGVSKYPFNETSYFRCHCAGGGAGAMKATGGGYNGGKGGTNGGNGTGPTYASNPTAASGGNYGGGSGGVWLSSSSITNSTAATFYGSGGGGGYTAHPNWPTNRGAAGYQGVIYIRIPLTA